jgi:hypothetical protein
VAGLITQDGKGGVSKIFIVEGVTGIFEQHRHWAVDAWQSKDWARARVVQLSVLVVPLNRLLEQQNWDELEHATQNMKKHDPDFSIATGGTHYRFVPCELKL